MAEIVNLRLARKRRRRDGAEERAAENRVRHGRTAEEKARLSLARELEEKRLAGHSRRDDPTGPE